MMGEDKERREVWENAHKDPWETSRSHTPIRKVMETGGNPWKVMEEQVWEDISLIGRSWNLMESHGTSAMWTVGIVSTAL